MLKILFSSVLSWRHTESDRWLSFCIADCFPRAIIERSQAAAWCTALQRGLPCVDAWTSTSYMVWMYVVYDREDDAPMIWPGRTWTRRKKNTLLFIIDTLQASSTTWGTRNEQWRLWPGKEIIVERALFSLTVECSKESCQLDANYIVFIYHQGQKWLKETFHSVMQF